MSDCRKRSFTNNNVCGQYDMLPSEKENGFRMYFNHKNHINLESAINLKCVINRGGQLIYELEFPDTEYTYWTSEDDFKEINMTIEELIPRYKNKKKHTLSYIIKDNNYKKYAFRNFYVSLLTNIHKSKKDMMLDTLPRLDEYEYTSKNVYKCIVDRNLDSLNKCECEKKMFNEVLKDKFPNIYNCSDDCSLFKNKTECINNHPPYSLCENMFFSMRKYPNMYIFQTEDKGFGVKSKGYIHSGNFIVDYCGEVFDNKTVKKMLSNNENKKKMGTYFQKLSDNNVISCYKMGNISRFINHSCEPNAKIERWISGTQYFLGIFALVEINNNEEITINYEYERYNTIGERCLCGKVTCSGNIGYFSPESLPNIDKTQNPERLIDIVKRKISTITNSHKIISELPLPEVSKETIHNELCIISSKPVD
ncbi:Histone-lysine N-methyltransferase SETD2 [Strongyloides ratti]|uniref:Histone-lysine N-methyltransferase SETD2 n=1 Tax=Strongyloides ratti TaxID=34506 RepID=A0A090N0Z2_STRRB|nr:Histone-lysine N-methyltransferase SETD2 [Strongyloides ratti]CEF71533.1 Histone-lysine N-methyltransferase SETD2 [Strongyloides ratti]